MTDQNKCAVAVARIHDDVMKRAEETISRVRTQVSDLVRTHGKETVTDSLSNFPLLRDIAGKFIEECPNTSKDDAAIVSAVARKLFAKQ